MRVRPDFAARWALVASCLATLAGTFLGCSAQQRRFPLRPPLWVDDDEHPFSQRPPVYWSPLVWDAADHSAFRPLTHALLLEQNHESTDVNALDEVPDSSWYTNRLSIHALTPDEVAAGPCTDVSPLPDRGTWTVLSSKPNGTTPGFIVRGPDGLTYVFKADGDIQPGQGTSGEVVGSRIFWAAGYNVACNRILNLRRDQFAMAPTAHYEDATGQRHAMTESFFDAIFIDANPRPDQTSRFSTSLFVEGDPIGPFRYEDTRSDDPNDVVPHEDRRELRAMRLLSAWLNHWDSREQNTLNTWVHVGDGGYVRHYVIDLGDSLGSLWPIDTLARRIGFSGYADFPRFFEDFFTLGLIDRPWDRIRTNEGGWPWGYFVADPFEPSQWRGGYPNPAYDRMTERDAAWMARIVARFTDDHIHAIVEQAQVLAPAWQDALERTIRVRRDRILQRYLTRVSPLADVTVSHGELCATDRARETHVYRWANYRAELRREPHAAHGTDVDVEPNGAAGLCVRLPAPAAPEGQYGYLVVAITAEPATGRASTPLLAHLYDLGPSRGWVLAGLER